MPFRYRTHDLSVKTFEKQINIYVTKSIKHKSTHERIKYAAHINDYFVEILCREQKTAKLNIYHLIMPFNLCTFIWNINNSTKRTHFIYCMAIYQCRFHEHAYTQMKRFKLPDTNNIHMKFSWNKKDRKHKCWKFWLIGLLYRRRDDDFIMKVCICFDCNVFLAVKHQPTN